MHLIVVVMKPHGSTTQEDFEHVVLINGTRFMFVPDPLHCFCKN
jgi:hypothetical protein